MKDREDQPREGEDAALWDLLGKSAAPRVSPYFVRRVMRGAERLDEEGSAAVRWLRRLSGGWRLPHPAWSGALAAALICAGSVTVAYRAGSSRLRHVAVHHVAARETREDLSPQDVEVIANLDNLMAYEENKIWTDDSNAD